MKTIKHKYERGVWVKTLRKINGNEREVNLKVTGSGENRKESIRVIRARRGKIRAGSARAKRGTLRARAKNLFGKREGQSILLTRIGDKRYYAKEGIAHAYDLERDRKIKAKRIRRPNAATWRGDAKGSVI